MPASNSSTITVDLPHGRGYPIHFSALPDAPRLFEEAGLQGGRALLVTDENVAEHYLRPLQDALGRSGWTLRTRVIPAGEASKSSEMLDRLYDWALEQPITRETPVIALGGGVVCDLAGYLAATLLRGLPLVQIPTSLIAQADSSIGGKTGINHPAGKNMIGAFHQPRLVLVDASVLTSLPERDYTSGLAEVVKHALIADAGLFDWLEGRWDDILQRADDAVREMVHRAASIKAAIVAEDELEAGRRKLLNFGHTFGHAIERASGYGTFTHGEAVAVGMRAALHLSGSVQSGSVQFGSVQSGSVKFGRAIQEKSPTQGFDRADALLSRIPVAGSLEGLSVEALTEAMQTDKKRDAERLQFVVLKEIGEARVVDRVSSEALEAAWNYAKAACRD